MVDNYGKALSNKFLNCPICYGKFGRSSLPIHFKACLLKNPKHKVPSDQVSSILDGTFLQQLTLSNESGIGTTSPELSPISVEKFNERAYVTYDANLIKCEICSRTFTGKNINTTGQWLKGTLPDVTDNSNSILWDLFTSIEKAFGHHSKACTVGGIFDKDKTPLYLRPQTSSPSSKVSPEKEKKPSSENTSEPTTNSNKKEGSGSESGLRLLLW